MAKILFGTIVTGMSGKVGGNVFSHGANGAYLKKKAGVINRNTISQRYHRNLFQSVVSAWRGLTSTQQATWSSASHLFPYVNSLGQTVYYTGFQLFSKLNNQAVNTFGTAFVTAPTPVVFPSCSVAGASFAIPTGPLNVIGQFGLSGSSIVPDGFIFVIEATTPLSLGVTSPKGSLFKYLAQINASVDTSVIDLTSSYFNLFGVNPTNTANSWVKCSLVALSSGQRSVSSTGIIVASF